MKKEELKKLILTAGGARKADTVIKNCKVVNVFSGKIVEGDIALCGDQIAGIGEYEGEVEIDAEGRYAAPGFIDSHIHIESSYLSPEELGRLLVPHGGTTIIAESARDRECSGDPGTGLYDGCCEKYELDIKYMLPSCVPATPFENAGAVIDAVDMEDPILRDNILGLGEFMNFPGVVNGDRCYSGQADGRKGCQES